LGKMEKHGCRPDQITYNTLIRGFLNNNEVKGALEIIDVMTAKGFQGDAETASLVFNLLSDDQVDKSVKKWVVKH